MRYLGGKMRQSKQIVAHIKEIHPQFKTYIEPFCGALWSGVAVIKAFPNRKYVFNDINPHLIRFWSEAAKGWNPPEHVSEATYALYNETRPLDDPMTGYIGFAWSFGGKFFRGAARTDGMIKGSYKSTREKIDVLRSADVVFRLGTYNKIPIPINAMVYLDPPYEGRTKQSKFHDFDKAAYIFWAGNLAKKSKVIATEFIEQPGWKILHNYGDTVVRHHSAKPADGTTELLMRVL
jgi:hypothetical protein